MRKAFNRATQNPRGSAKGHHGDKRKRFTSDYVVFSHIMPSEVAAPFQEEPFEVPDFVTEDLPPFLLRRVKAAEGSALAAKVRCNAFHQINKADADELCQLLNAKGKHDPLEDKETPKVLDLQGFILLSGPLLGLPLPALTRARDESDSEDELPPVTEMMRCEEAEAVFHQLPLEKDGCIPASVLATELASESSQVRQFLSQRAAECSEPMKSRKKLERLINWRIERDDALGTLFFTFVLLIVLYLLVQVNLDIKSHQQAETAVRSYIATFGGQLQGPFMNQHIADVTSFWSWAEDSAMAAFFGVPVLGLDGITRFHLAGSNVLLGDVLLSHTDKDGEVFSDWLLHSAAAQSYLSSTNSSDYFGAAKAALRSLRRNKPELIDPHSRAMELSCSIHNEQAGKLILVRVNSLFFPTGDMDLQIFTNACEDTAQIAVEQAVVNIFFLCSIGWLAFLELKDAVAALAHGCKAFTEYWGLWNTVDWTCIGLAIVTMIVWWMKLQNINSEQLQAIHQDGFDSLALTSAELATMQDELQRIRGWSITVRVLTTLLAVTVVMKFFKGFRANPRLQIVADAIANSVNNVAHFFLIFWTLFACFAIVAHMLFGNDIILFSSLLSSLEASMSTLMGEFEWYVQITGKKSGYLNSGVPMVFVHLWFVVYICFALLVLFNMLLAMVLDSYGAAAQVLGKRADAPTIVTQTWRYFRRWQETRGFIPLRTLARDLLSLECHPHKVVTVTSLQSAFPQMKQVQACYLMRTLFQEDKRQKATQEVLEGKDVGVFGASEDFDPKDVAAACVPAFTAAAQPLLAEFMSKLAVLEVKVEELQSHGLFDAEAEENLRLAFAKEMMSGIKSGRMKPRGGLQQGVMCCGSGAGEEYAVEQL